MLTLQTLTKKAAEYEVVVSHECLVRYQTFAKQLVDAGVKNFHNPVYNFLKHEIHTIETDLFRRYREIIDNHKGGLSHTYERYVLSYGVYADQKWESRRKFMSDKNTFEFKKRRYGWSEEDFDNFNATRKQTKQRMVERYGEVEGTCRWESYVAKQQIAGVTLEWFQQKHGLIGGEMRWKVLCKTKAHNFENYMKKYGCAELAAQKLIQKYSKQTPFFSSKSQNLFELIRVRISSPPECVYYAQHQGEFGSYDSVNQRYYKYDFVDTQRKICIEFNGDHYHGNPNLYKPDDIPKALRGNNKKTAKQCWEADKIKLSHIESQGYQTVVVWEADFDSDVNAVVAKIWAEYGIH